VILRPWICVARALVGRGRTDGLALDRRAVKKYPDSEDRRLFQNTPPWMGVVGELSEAVERALIPVDRTTSRHQPSCNRRTNVIVVNSEKDGKILREKAC